MDKKGWLKSKTFWSDVLTIGVAILQISDQYFGTHIGNSQALSGILGVLGILGIYGRKHADTKLEGVI